MATGVPVRERPLTILIRIVAAQVGQIAADTALSAPIRRLQMVLQTQDLQELEEPYTTAYDAFRRSAAANGLGSLWRGTTSTVLSASALQLATSLLSGVIRDPIDQLTDADMALASDPLGWNVFMRYSLGTSALALCTWLPLYPLHLVSVVQTADCAKQPRYKDTLDGLRTLYDGGLEALFAGVGPRLLGMTVDRVIQHFLIILLVRSLRLDEEDSDPSPFSLLVATQLMSVASRVLNYPFELISRRMQVQVMLAKKPYKDALDCARQLTDNWSRPLGLWSHFSQCAVLDLVYAAAALGAVPVNRMLAWSLGLRVVDDDEDEDEADDDDGGARRGRGRDVDYDDDDDDDDD